MRTVEISVTADHIDRGTQCCTTRCPVALAIRDTLHPLSVDVQDDLIHFGVSGGKYVFVHTPEEAGYFVDEFDDGLPVQPFTFILEVPDEVTAA